MGPGEWVAVAGIGLTVLTMLVSGIWFMARTAASVKQAVDEVKGLRHEMKEHGSALRNELQRETLAVRSEIVGLRDTLRTVFERQDGQSARLGRVEGAIGRIAGWCDGNDTEP
jgi:hypothetical protein